MAAAAGKQTAAPKGPKQGRSPSYPGITLTKALEQAQALYDSQGKYPAPLALAYAAWGFKPKSSGARETRAALRYFGLITVEGQGDARKIKLTDTALRVLLDEREDQSEKLMFIRELALRPNIHKRLREQFPEGIKSDASAEHYLVFEQGFNKQAAAELVAQYKVTAEFAGIYKPGVILDKSLEEEQDTGDDEEDADDVAPDPLNERLAGAARKIKIMEGERVVFTEETDPQNYVRLVASGSVDDSLLEALEDYVKRQRKRLQRPSVSEKIGSE